MIEEQKAIVIDRLDDVGVEIEILKSKLRRGEFTHGEVRRRIQEIANKTNTLLSFANNNFAI